MTVGQLHTEDLKRCVVDLSVYNCVSFSGHDLTDIEVVNFLRAGWQPAFDHVEKVVTIDSVQESAKRLEAHGLVNIDGERITLPTRNVNRHGIPVYIDRSAARLVWR